MESTTKPKPAELEPVPVSFTVRRPTPLSLSRDTSTGPDESDSSASASARPFKVVPLPRHLRGSEREEDARVGRKGSPLARSAATTATASSGSVSGSGGIDVPNVDSSDSDDDGEGDEPVTAFDRLSGALNESSTGNRAGKKRRRSESNGGAPLVIPALKNRDWRELARRRRGVVGYVPGQGPNTNTNGVVGQDSINTGPVLVGLQVKARTMVAAEERNGDGDGGDVEMVAKVVEETEDEMALRLVLAESSKGEGDDGPVIESIPIQQRQTITEADALKQDVEELPDSASLEDYARVPVAQFGAALLRGMGWKAKKDSELYLPEARPALLGIGAKEQEVYDDGSQKKKKRRDLNSKGPYLPVKQVVREERTRGSRSRRGSRSPDRYASSRRDRDRRV